MHRNSIRAAKLRDHLFSLLGTSCQHCGSAVNLEFDVIIPDDEPKSHHGKMSWLQRMNYYIRQFDARNLQVLCDKCNTRKSNHTEEAG